MLGPQPVADIGCALHEGGVVAHERLVDAAGRDDVVGDVVEDRQIRARLEDDRHVGQIHAAMGEGRQHRDLDMRMAEPAVGQPRPQDRVHLGHVRAPQHEGVGSLEIVVAAHRLVHAECPHEGVGGRRHAVARIGIEVVGAEAGPHQLGRGIAFDRWSTGRSRTCRLPSAPFPSAPACIFRPSRRRPRPRIPARTRLPCRRRRCACAKAAWSADRRHT